MKSAWPKWKKEETFVEIIDGPRNTLLKEGELPIERHMGISWSGPFENPEDAQGAAFVGHLFIEDGGRNVLDELWQAVYWWCAKLGEVHRASQA